MEKVPIRPAEESRHRPVGGIEHGPEKCRQGLTFPEGLQRKMLPETIAVPAAQRGEVLWTEAGVQNLNEEALPGQNW